MEAMREAWTDDRLDDLANRMDRGFDRVDTDIRELRAETKAEFKGFRSEVDQRFDKVDAQFERVHNRLDSIHHVIIAAAVTVTTASIAGIVTVVATGL